MSWGSVVALCSPVGLSYASALGAGQVEPAADTPSPEQAPGTWIPAGKDGGVTGSACRAHLPGCGFRWELLPSGVISTNTAFAL